jgi:hypothetical protein
MAPRAQGGDGADRDHLQVGPISCSPLGPSYFLAEAGDNLPWDSVVARNRRLIINHQPVAVSSGE